MECPICYEEKVSIFTNNCGHTWCKECHNKLVQMNHTTCPMCRDNIVLQKHLPKNHYIEWLLVAANQYMFGEQNGIEKDINSI